ncbi:MAG TPA: hypothetical protein VIL95_07905 [Bacillota bacterium]
MDTEIVWNTATRDLPALKSAVERLLRTLEARDSHDERQGRPGGR